MSFIEIIATFFGLVCVWFTIKQNIWCWPAGVLQVFLFIFVFYEARLYSDMLLHIVYVFLNSYGWYHWANNKSGQDQSGVTSLGRSMVAWTLVCIAGTIGLGYLMEYYTNASLPYPDSLIAAASLIAQWLMAKKKLESWYFWILVDVVGIGVYCMKDLYLTAALYAIFLILSLIGWVEWRKTFLQSKALSQVIS